MKIYNLINTKILTSIKQDLSMVANILTDNSPIIKETMLGTFDGTVNNPVRYPNGVSNIVGDFKNSWSINENVVRNPDPSGFDSKNISKVKSELVNFGINTIQNGVSYSKSVNENYGVVDNSKDEIMANLTAKYKGGTK